MSWQPNSFTFDVNSIDPPIKSVNGGSFELNFQPKLTLPPKKIRNPTLEVDSALVWWNTSNVEEKVNDKIYITGPDATNDHTVSLYEITIPSGLYDVAQLQEAIERQLENKGARSDPEPLITLSPDEATNRVELQLNYSTVIVDFTPLDTFRDMLGMNSQIIGPSAIIPFTKLADEVARFNTTEYFLIHSSLVQDGIAVNNVYSQVIARVNIDVEVGTQIVFDPRRPRQIPLDGLDASRVRFWLTDQSNREINTNTEDWTVGITVRWLEWVPAPARE